MYIRSLGTNFSEILIKVQQFSFTKYTRLWNGGHFVQRDMSYVKIVFYQQIFRLES